MNLRNLIPPMPARMQKSYPQEVMARVRAEQLRQPRKSWEWLPQPRFAFALGGALAALLAILVIPSTPCRIVRQIDRDSGTISSGQSESVSDLVEEMEALDAVGEGEGLSMEEMQEDLKELDQSEMSQA